jgi:hypothetical protein
MELNKNAFPIQLDLQKVISIIEKELKKKGHNININKKMFHINVVPYWFCFYDIYVIENNKPDTISNQLALNAMTNKIEDGLTNLFDVVNPKMLPKIEVQDIEKIEIRIKEIIVSKEEAKKTLEKIVAATHKVPINNISLSGFKEIWVPFWKLETDDFHIRVDAVGGVVNNFEKIPKKEKTHSALYNEMLNELKSPKKVGLYFLMMFEVVFRVFKNVFLFLKKYKEITVVVLVIILLLLLFYF